MVRLCAIRHSATNPLTYHLTPARRCQVHNYRFDYAPEGGTARGVSFARLGFSREAQRTRSSSSVSVEQGQGHAADGAAGANGAAHDAHVLDHRHHHHHVADDGAEEKEACCLHLPSDRDEADWLCLDLARAKRELTAAMAAEGGPVRRARKEKKPSATRGLGFTVRPRSGGGGQKGKGHGRRPKRELH